MAHNKGNAALIAIIVVIIVIIAGVFTWLDIKQRKTSTEQASAIQQGAESEKTRNAEQELVESQKAVAKKTLKESMLYENTEFSFQLTLPGGWDDYKSYSAGDIGANVINFELPTYDPEYMSSSNAGYSTVFILNVYDKSKWEELLSGCKKYWSYGCVKEEDLLANNGTYYIFSEYPQMKPTDFIDKKGTGKVDIDHAYLKANLKFTE